MALCCPAQEHVNQLLFLEEVRVLPARGKRQDRGKVAAQHDRQFLTLRNQFDTADKCAHPVGRLRLRLLVVKLVVERNDLFVIDFGDVRVEKGRRFFRRLQHGCDILLALFHCHHLGVDAVSRSALEDEIEKRVEFPIDLPDLGLGRLNGNARSHPGLVRFPREFLTEILEQFWLHQMLVEAVQYGGFERVTADVEPVVAGALAPGIGAAKKVLGNHRIAATAATALDEAGEQMLRPASLAHEVLGSLLRGIVSEFLLPFSHGVPGVLIDNAQVGNILNDPFAFRVHARDAFSCVRIFDVAQPVPDQLADIKFVVEDAGPALRVAVNGGRSPFAALRSWHAFAVQDHGDGPRRLPFQIVHEDAAHDIRFGVVDGALAPAGFASLIELAHYVIAVAKPAARLSVLDPAAQAAPCLVGKVFDIKRAHRALQADM